MFTKKDLQAGDWLELQDGTWFQFLNEKIAVDNISDQFFDLCSLSEQMECPSCVSCEVVSVVRPTRPTEFLFSEKNQGLKVFRRTFTVEQFKTGDWVLVSDMWFRFSKETELFISDKHAKHFYLRDISENLKVTISEYSQHDIDKVIRPTSDVLSYYEVFKEFGKTVYEKKKEER